MNGRWVRKRGKLDRLNAGSGGCSWEKRNDDLGASGYVIASVRTKSSRLLISSDEARSVPAIHQENPSFLLRSSIYVHALFQTLPPHLQPSRAPPSPNTSSFAVGAIPAAAAVAAADADQTVSAGWGRSLKTHYRTKIISLRDFFTDDEEARPIRPIGERDATDSKSIVAAASSSPSDRSIILQSTWKKETRLFIRLIRDSRDSHG